MVVFWTSNGIFRNSRVVSGIFATFSRSLELLAVQNILKLSLQDKCLFHHPSSKHRCLPGCDELVTCDLCLCLRCNSVIHRGQKPIQGDDNGHVGRPCQVSPTPPYRNPCELRGLCSRSYFGPRTCGGSITNVIEVDRVLNPGFPFSPLNVHFCVHPQVQR